MAIKSELGNIQIFFGQVVDIDDPSQMLRCRVAIPGKTDDIEKEKLPWYYSWNGLSSLPALNDEVPVIIFDGNFSTGFYGSTLISGAISNGGPGNYTDNVQVFKKFTCNSDAQITYSISNGIEITNNNTGIKAEVLKLQMFCGANNISITENTISLGNGPTQAALKGDDTILWIRELLDLLNKIIQSMYGGFQTIMTAALPSPFTTAIGAALIPVIPGELQFRISLMMLQTKLLELQSKTLYHS